MVSSRTIQKKLEGRRGRLGPAGEAALAFIRNNPGASILAVDRGARTARGGHKWMYATVHRLIRSGHVRAEKGPGGSYRLYAAEG